MRLCMWTCVLVAVPSSIWEFVKGVGLLQWHSVADCLPVQFTCIHGRDSHSICFNYEIILFHNILFESIPRMLNKMHKSYWSYYLKSWGTSATSRCVTWLTRGVLSSCSAAQRPVSERNRLWGRNWKWRPEVRLFGCIYTAGLDDQFRCCD